MAVITALHASQVPCSSLYSCSLFDCVLRTSFLFYAFYSQLHQVTPRPDPRLPIEKNIFTLPSLYHSPSASHDVVYTSCSTYHFTQALSHSLSPPLHFLSLIFYSILLIRLYWLKSAEVPCLCMGLEVASMKVHYSILKTLPHTDY